MRLTNVNANAYGRNFSHSETSFSSSMVEHTMITAQESRRRSRERFEGLFWICRLKEKARWPSVLHFEGRLPSGSEEICDLCAEFIQRTYTDDGWVASDPSPEHVPDESPFGAIQFTSDKVESGLQGLDVNKGFGPHGIPPIILKNCASAFAKPLSLLFNRYMATSVFPDRWKVLYVTSIFKKGYRRNNVEDYRFVACLFGEECTTT
jgi:hypothetical protein